MPPEGSAAALYCACQLGTMMPALPGIVWLRLRGASSGGGAAATGGAGAIATGAGAFTRAGV